MSWKLIAAVAESHLRRCVTAQKFKTLCASRSAKQTETVEDIVVVSIAARVRRRLSSGLPSRRSNVLVPTRSQSRLNISAWTLVADHWSAGLIIANSFAIVELAQAAPRLSGRRLAATVAKRFFTHHNLAVLVNHLARVSANVSQGAVILLLPINVIPTMWIALPVHT
jgi:hypothetical protein